MSQHSVAVFQALFVVFLWATSWVFVKIGLHDIPPVTFAGMRYFLAFLCLLAVLLSNKAKDELSHLTKTEWMRFIVLGILLYAGTQGAVFVALDYLPAVTVNLMWSFSSAIIAILGVTFLSERPTFFQWAGILLAIVGAVIYFYPAEIPANQSIGFIVAVLGVLSNAASSILGRDINRISKHSPLVVTVISMGIGSIVLLVAGIALEDASVLSIQSWAIVVWLALVNTAFAFTLWNLTLRTLTAMQSGLINGTMLIWVAIFAVIFLDETITPRELIGLAATSIGTLVVQLRSTTSRNQT